MPHATMPVQKIRKSRPLSKFRRADYAKQGQRYQNPKPTGHRSPRILCIDDDPEICRTLEMRLGEYQAEVLVAYFGTQGFWEAITDHPDLILMDVSMPSGDGRFVLESLRQNQTTERIPVIVFTGMRDPHLKTEMLALGADSFLHKPLHFDVLLREMRQYVCLENR